MTTVNQVTPKVNLNFDEIAARTALWERNWTVSELARRIGRPRPTVSVAIKHGRFREVRKEIAAALNFHE